MSKRVTAKYIVSDRELMCKRRVSTNFEVSREVEYFTCEGTVDVVELGSSRCDLSFGISKTEYAASTNWYINRYYVDKVDNS